MLLTGGLCHTQTCNPVQKQPRTGTQHELIMLTWPAWRSLQDLKNFKNIWRRWRLFQDVWEKTESRTTMKGNCMPLDCKRLVCSPRGGEGGSLINTPEFHQSLDVVIIKQILKIWGRETRKIEWIPLQRHGIVLSDVSASQAFPHKAALQVGGLEGSAVIKAKARADESAERFCCTSDWLWGQRSAGKRMNMHGNNAAHPQVPQVTRHRNHKTKLYVRTRWNHSGDAASSCPTCG